MTDTVRSTPTEERITHDLLLSDGVTQVGLIVCNSRGIPINSGTPWTLRQSGSSRTSLQIRTGDPDYSDYQLPYTPFTQKDWSGGRGLEDFEKDTKRFADSNCMDTHMGDMILGPKDTEVVITTETYIEPVADNSNLVEEVTGGIKYASSYTTTQEINFNSITVRAAPGHDLTIEIIKDSAGAPSNDPADLVATASISVPELNYTSSTFGASVGEAPIGWNAPGHGVFVENPAETVEVEIDIEGTLATTTKYWVVLDTTAVGYAPLIGIAVFEYDGGWTSLHTDNCLYFKLSTYDKGDTLFFNYKDSMYLILNHESAIKSKLFINGYRGVAQTGSTQNKIIVPVGMGLTANELAGCILQVTAGTCYNEEKNFRTVTSNTTTSITLSTPFKNTPDITTEYVILGSNKWTKISGTGLTSKVTSVCVANERVYLAQGEDVTIRVMREYNNAGTWTRSFYALGSTKATFIGAFPDHTGNEKIWIFNNPATGAPTAAYSSINREHVLNGSFENSGSGDPDVFSIWKETKGNGTIAGESGSGNFKPDGSSTISAKLTTGADTNCKISQDILVIPLNSYSFTFWAKGDGTNIAKYSIVDKTNSADIVAATNVGTATTVPVEVSINFTAPTGCYLVRINLIGAAVSGAIVYFDTVSVKDNGFDFITKPDELVTTPPSAEIAYPIQIGDARSKITGIVAYGDPILPYVMKEDEFGNINNGIYAKVPVAELSQVKSRFNGRVSIQFGVYLFTSVLEGLERYYDNRLDDVGPNRDEGFPADRRGKISSIVSYPGGLYLAIDAGSDGYSSLLYWNQLGYHEYYRAPYGERIHSLYIQPIPNKSARLWIGMSDTTRWIPVCINPRQQTDYRYTSTGSLESAWFNGGFKEISKFWKSVQVYAEGLSDGQYVSAQYKTDIDDTWHSLPEIFDVSPMQEVLMATDYSVYGKRWKYRLTLTTNDDVVSPRVKAVTVPAVTRLPPNKAWSMTVLADDALVDRQGTRQRLTAKELMDQLEEWADSEQSPLPLTMRSAIAAFDNKRIFIEPPTIQPIEVENGAKKSLKAIVSLSVYEA